MEQNDSSASGGMFQMIKLAPSLLPLTFKMGLSLLKLKRDARKAANIFERELLGNGIDGEKARIMKETYLESSRVIPLLLSVKR